jgi:hypothetical protein
VAGGIRGERGGEGEFHLIFDGITELTEFFMERQKAFFDGINVIERILFFLAERALRLAALGMTAWKERTGTLCR